MPVYTLTNLSPSTALTLGHKNLPLNRAVTLDITTSEEDSVLSLASRGLMIAVKVETTANLSAAVSGSADTLITQRDSAGNITQYTEAGVSWTVSYDSNGDVTSLLRT